MEIKPLIQNTYATLSTQDDLSPHNAMVNESLSKLVSGLNSAYQAMPFLENYDSLDVEKKRLPEICGQAECEMEKYWVQQLLLEENPNLESFWYYENYKNLWLAEKAILENIEISRLIFLGSGALPLTAILAAQQDKELKIVCVDSDDDACLLSKELLDRLDLSDRICVVCQTAQSFEYTENDMVICASLIERKKDLYQKLYADKVKNFLVRDVEGIYEFLYKPSELPSNIFYKEVRKTLTNPSYVFA